MTTVFTEITVGVTGDSCEEWQFLKVIGELGVKARTAESIRCVNSEPVIRDLSDSEKQPDAHISVKAEGQRYRIIDQEP